MQDVLDEKQPDIALAMGSFVEVYEMQSRYDESERLKEQILTLQFRTRGEAPWRSSQQPIAIKVDLLRLRS